MDGPGTPAASEDNKVAASPAASGEGNRVIVTGEKREWIPSKERLQQQSQQQQQPPRQERKRDDSYTASTSKSNDWFDERSSYDTFGSRPDTNTRSTRTNTNPQVEADRLDSERILNELLMDLDSVNPRSSTDSDGGVDYFDFSVDSDDVNGKDKSASKSRQPPSRAPASSAQAGGNRNVAPKMEDFASFEQYLDALVSHERTSSSAGSKSSWDSSRTGGRVPDNRANTKVDKVEMDALDDTLVAFLGADDEDDMSGRLRSQSNSRSGDRSGDAPKRSWNPKPSSPSVMSEVKSDDKIDDLSSFLDSLEESNVLPSKSKIVDVVAPKAVEVPVVTEKKVAKKSTPAPVKAPEPVAAVAEVQSVGGFTSLSLKDLKDILRERGLPVSGNKADLVKRLNQ